MRHENERAVIVDDNIARYDYALGMIRVEID